MTGFSVAHSGHNLSNHFPIFISLPFHTFAHTIPKLTKKPVTACWSKASTSDIMQYQRNLDHHLASVSIPDACAEGRLGRNRPDHTLDIHCFFMSIVLCIKVSLSSIPQSAGHSPPNRRQQLAGWRHWLQPLRDRSIFWHHLWRQMGSPLAGTVAGIHRKARRSYHQAVRMAKYCSELLHSINASLCFRSDKFWSFVKRFRKGKSTNAFACIDGICDNSGIADKFAAQYEQLYNQSYSTSINLPIQSTPNVCTITTDDVLNAFSALKKGKGDGCFEFLTSDCLHHGSLLLAQYTATLLNMCLVHGFVPQLMCDVLFKPILKPGKNDRTDSNNYRAIAYGSVFFKLFEIIFIIKFGDKLGTSSNQFGFKKGHSTVSCCWVLIEVVIHYVCRFSLVFACFLDCTKAFDRVNLGVLLDVLKKRGVDQSFLALLHYVFMNQKGRVLCNGISSRSFAIRNGVRQGGILSPYLFAIYIDDIVALLKSSCCGCYHGTAYVGILMYADDIVLLCPSIRGLRNMLTITVNHFTSINLQFNPNKTFALSFGAPSVVQYSLTINGVAVRWVSEVKYLGIILNSMLDHSYHVNRTVCDFYARSNAILATFPRFSHDVLMFLFNSYCCSLYGIMCVSISDNNLRSLHVAWNKVVRRIYGLPFQTHTNLLSPIIGKTHIKFQIFSNFINFAYSAFRSPNPIVRSIAHNSGPRLTTLFGSNLCYVLSQFRVNVNEFARYSKHDLSLLLKRIKHVGPHSYRTGFIRELITPNNIDSADARIMLNYLCCS
jgi:hypothetical protein